MRSFLRKIRSMLRNVFAACLCLVGLASTEYSFAAVQSRTITYTHNNREHRGYLAWDDAVADPRPGVLVVHEWWGLNDYARQRVDMLAELGYVAFAADMYGDGRTTEHPQEAGRMAAEVRQNAGEWVARATAALDVLKSQPQCDPSRLAAIGYCFGGSTALQLAFSGAELRCVASFHGALMTPTPEQVRRTKASLLVCHGAQDAFIPEESVQQFRAALDAGGADWELVYYAGARHGFTVPHAEDRGLEGLKYNAAADRRSWARLQALFAERLVP
jgi:dienelactone hydrolase